MKPRIANLLMCLVGIVIPVVIFAQSMVEPIPESLAGAIRKLYPSATIVSAKEVDATSCQPVGNSPGLIRADFNGDGQQDYAVLLKIRVNKKETIWEGKSLREARFAFVIFLDDGAGGFRPRVIRRYDDFVPTAVVIDLQPAGKIRHRETHKDVQVPMPAVVLSFCEKSATAYYLVDDKFRLIPIAD